MLDSLALTGSLALTLLPAAILVVAALVVGRCATAATAWRIARTATAMVGAAAAAVVVARVVDGVHSDELVRLDSITAVMLSLVAIVGWVVVRFSANYLTGDAHEQRYAGRMLATLAAVSMVVVSNNLVLLVVAWAATSVALHGLLTYFGDRPVAVAVAHKKFLLARCADACMVGATIAFGLSFDTLRIDEIAAAAAGTGSLSVGAHVAIVLVAISALLKCAQLPFHGWLIQVMEAPTPVSALLHAGVVNLGGFVLLRFAPVVDLAVGARTLLVVVGVATAVAASLVMTTRVSVKVALAWSTCAQMGFMLMQCGLGLWEMALLHLVAHSLYKAYAFLSAGGTVRQTQRRRLAPMPAPPTGRALAAATALALATTALVGVAWQALPGTDRLSAGVWVLLGVVALATVPFAASIGRSSSGRRGASSIGRMAAVPAVYLVLHEVFAELTLKGANAPIGLLVITAAGFVTLFVLQVAARSKPDGRLVSRVRPWVYGGLFLDEAFTRLAFTVAPPPKPEARPAPLPRPHAVAMVPVATSASRPTSAPAEPTPAAVVAAAATGTDLS